MGDATQSVALHRQAADVAKHLLNGRSSSANPDIPDDQGRTALHAAALRGAYAVCSAIAEHGKVDVAAVDHHGETALHLAIRGGSVDCVLTLLSVVDNLSAAARSKAFDASALIDCSN